MRIKTILRLLSLFLFTSCATRPPTYVELSDNDPANLIAMQDSLILAEPENVELLAVLSQAHVKIALDAMANDDVAGAMESFNSSLKLNKNNKIANYHFALQSGHKYLKKGSRMALWDAIEQYSRAGRFILGEGEPFYWIGRAYEKKDDQDFDLIVESFDKAITLGLPNELRIDCLMRREAVLKRKRVFEEFWR